jgi:hypothetical protein
MARARSTAAWAVVARAQQAGMPVIGILAAEGREIDRARRALRLQRLKVFDREDPFAASFGAPRIQQKPTSILGANGPGSCATQACTRQIPRHWTTSSSARAASTRARLADAVVFSVGARGQRAIASGPSE